MAKNENLREWTVQVLDEKDNVKYQASLHGTEKKAKALLAKFEAKWRDEKDHG